MVVSHRRIYGLYVAQVLVELVEPFGPGPAVLFDPSGCRVERCPLEMTRPELRIPGPRDKAATLEHLEVLGDAGKGHRERRRQLIYRGIAPRQAVHDRPARGVSQGGERQVQSVLYRRHALLLPASRCLLSGAITYLTSKLVSCQVNYDRRRGWPQGRMYGP